MTYAEQLQRKHWMQILLSLQKQYEFMQYADEAADLDAEYYGVA
jgi:hypothetical protein